MAGEVYRPDTGVIARQNNTPVFDLEATLSTMDTGRSAARQAAQDLRAAVDRVRAGRPAEHGAPSPTLGKHGSKR